MDKDSGYEYALENNAFKRGANLLTGERTWIIYNERYGVEISVVVADMVIETFNDLKVFDGVIKQHTYGYYVLNNDINYLGQNFGFSSTAFFGIVRVRPSQAICLPSAVVTLILETA